MARYDEKGGLGAAELLNAMAKGAEVAEAEKVLQGAVMDPFPGQWMERTGGKCGPCVGDAEDATQVRIVETLFTVRRYAVIYVPIVRTAAGDLVIKATTAPLKAFAAGVGENGAASGLLPTTANLTRAETDGSKSGALVPLEKLDFRVDSIGVQILPPFRLMTADGDAAARMSEDFWLHYGPRIAEALAFNSHLTIRHGAGNSTGFELGRMDFYPPMAGVQGGSMPSIGRPLAGAKIPLARPDFAGGPEEDDNLTVELWVDHSAGTVNNGIDTVPALGGGEAFLLPVSLELYGRNVRNNNITNKAEVEAVATGAALKVLSIVAEDVDTSDPASVARFKTLLRKLSGR